MRTAKVSGIERCGAAHAQPLLWLDAFRVEHPQRPAAMRSRLRRTARRPHPLNR